MTLRITGAGLQTTVQDLGRPAHQREGIPVGGAMDRLACRIANLLVGNAEGDGVLEATLIGPAIEFTNDTLIAIGGADLEAKVNDTQIAPWHAVLAPAGSTLRFGKAARGCRAYIAVGGGIEVPPVFGSRSTYVRAGFGGLHGRALRAGDELSCGDASALSQRIGASIARRAHDGVRIATWSVAPDARPAYAADVVVRLVDGAQTEQLAPDSREALYSSRFRISASSDRMGYRLEGPSIAFAQPIEMLSEAVTFGTVQLPPGGAPIVLMADRQTTGGYPRIGEVASVDLPLIAQLKPGDTLRFISISLEEAQRLYLARERDLAQARVGIALRSAQGKP